MTIEELVRETLVEKSRRLRQEKCLHQEVYSTSCTSKEGAFQNSFCLDCGKAWFFRRRSAEARGETR
jgi:hypothetical protein